MKIVFELTDEQRSALNKILRTGVETLDEISMCDLICCDVTALEAASYMVETGLKLKL